MDFNPRDSKKRAAEADAPADKELVASEFEISDDGLSSVITTKFDNGIVSRTVMPFKILMSHLHKLRAVAGQMVNRQRLYDARRGVDAVERLATDPLRAAAISLTLDKLTSDFLVTIQFTDMAPIAVLVNPILANELNTERLMALLNALN